MKKLLVVAAIIQYENQILCMQRGESEYAYLSYKYEFPGGKVEPGESLSEALMRELKEEMDIDVTICEKDYLLMVNHQYLDFEIILYCFTCRVKTKKFTRKAHVGHQWLKKEELMKVEWAPADIAIVKNLMGR